MEPAGKVGSVQPFKSKRENLWTTQESKPRSPKKADQSKTLAREQEAEKQSKVDASFVRKQVILTRAGQITKSGGKDPRTDSQKSPKKNSYYNLFLTSCFILWAPLYIWFLSSSSNWQFPTVSAIWFRMTMVRWPPSGLTWSSSASSAVLAAQCVFRAACFVRDSVLAAAMRWSSPAPFRTISEPRNRPHCFDSHCLRCRGALRSH